MKVMHLKWILYSAIAPFICRTGGHPGPHASACHPNTESILIVITFIAAPCKWSAAKFSCPYHKWSVEQAALLQVLKQPGDRLINCKSIIAVIPDDPAIPIPLPPVSGSTPLDVDSHFARVGREQSTHAHLVKSYHLISTTGGSLLRPIAINLRIPRHALRC